VTERWLAESREAAGGEDYRPTQLQTEYIATSRQAASKLQRKFLIGTAVTLVVVALLAVVAYLQRQEAERQRKEAVRQQTIADERRVEAERQSRIALSRQLAAQSQAMVSQQPKLIERAGLLAIEAAQLHPSLETDQALRAVLALLPRAHLSLPCKGDVQEVAFSPDGDSLLVADGDHVLRCWNLPKRQEKWQTPIEKDSNLLGISFSSDGRLCILKSSNGSSAYETATGRLIAKGKQTAAFDKEIAVSSPRARFAAVFSGEGPSARVRVSDTATQRLLGEVPSDWDVVEAQVDDRGRFVVMHGDRGVQTRIWALSPLKEFARFSDNTVQRVFFSPGRLVLCDHREIGRVVGATLANHGWRGRHRDPAQE